MEVSGQPKSLATLPQEEAPVPTGLEAVTEKSKISFRYW